MREPRTGERDLPARLLELGLAAIVILAPLPFGAVTAGGRVVLELCALALGLLWLARTAFRPGALPSSTLRAGILGLLLLTALQLAPLGAAAISGLSPRSIDVRQASLPPPAARSAERRILGRDPSDLDAPAALSVDPPATASALRSGTALAALLLVACTVAAARGAGMLAAALLISASFQGLYGLLVLASGYDRIWHLPKRYYLESATGTFVNRNHFACFLAMALACGLALILRNARREARPERKRRFVELLGEEGSRSLVLLLLFLLGLAGLLVSFSRAGIALGLLALLLTLLVGARAHRPRARLLATALALAVAAVPLAQIGTDRLFHRYAKSGELFSSVGGRASVWRDTLSLAVDFPLAGSGFGTFAAAYPVYRSPEVRAYYAHAHNDLLQAIAEGGAVGSVLWLLVLVPLARTLFRALRGEKGTLGVGFAAGLAAFLLHSLVDFNFHIPANAATAAILAGTLLGLPWRNRS